MSFEEELIDEMQKYEILYNKKLKSYRNNNLREQTWQKIATKLKADVDTCKTRWKNLRDTFCKEVKKLPSGSEADANEIKWCYFQRLLFLKEFVSPRKTTTNLEQLAYDDIIEESIPSPSFMKPAVVSENEVKVIHNTEDFSMDSPSTPDTLDLFSPSTSRQRKRKKTATGGGEIEGAFSKFMKTMEDLTKKRFDNKHDPGDEGFCKLLMSKLQSLPEKVKEETKMDILNLVHSRVVAQDTP